MFKRAQCLLLWRPRLALLATAFTDQHPDIVTLFKQNDIHIVRNGDEERVFKQNTNLEMVEFFLDESPNATVDPLSVSMDHPRRNLLSLIFFQTRVTVPRIKWRAIDMRPAVDDENCRIFARLLRVCFALDVGRDYGGVLHLATSREQEVLVRVALDHGAEVDGRTVQGATALHMAVAKSADYLIKLLIEKGACVNAQDEDGWTPLHDASQNCSLKIVKLLLKYNADIHAKSTHSWRYFQGKGSTPLHKAVDTAGEDTAAIVRLLLKAGAYVDAKDDGGFTPLHYTLRPEIQEILLQNGADVNSEGSDRRMPIHNAVEKGSVASLEILLDYGARVNRTLGEQSLLELAYKSYRSDSEVSKFLLEFCSSGPQLRWEIGILWVFNTIVKYFGEWSILYRRQKVISWSKILSCHVIKITSLHELSSDSLDVQKIWQENSETVDQFRQKCVAEVARMKAHKLGGTDLSVRDFLIRDEYQVARLLRNQAMLRAVDPDALTKQFPLYGSILAHHVGKGKHRKWLQKEGVRSLNSLGAWFKAIPDDIKEAILGWLDAADILNVKRASAFIQDPLSTARC